MNMEVNEKENERKEEGEWEGDDRNWLSDEGESENSVGEEEGEKLGAWNKFKHEVNFEESFIADSLESAHACKGNNGKNVMESDPDGMNPDGEIPDPIPDPKTAENNETEPNKTIGLNKIPSIEKESQPRCDTDGGGEKDPDGLESVVLKSGEVSNKLKNLLSRNVPIEERLVMVGKDLMDTQRKIWMKEGRVNNFSRMEKRITRSQSKNWRKKKEEDEGKKEGETGVDSDSSLSIGVLQRLEEVGKLSRLRRGEVGGNHNPRLPEMGVSKT
ncbi:hypothetical protein L2E82_09863 [Cichorium intybus]|uniref:Uncharacterized protein n=1 Tax=Cichorium intybus TaxID=13427 RepID=A0ACB9G986_CICIN|nr:hypothetical protein L2E82_09863 [Cichorium intybus]